MNRTILAFAAAVVSAAVVQAKTVLWYHFDEEAPGTRTTDSSVIVDAAGTQNGIPEYHWNDNPKSNNSSFMPAYSNAFPNGCVWFDPVSGAKGAQNRCLHIVNPPNRGEYGNGEHGVVRIPNNDKLHLQTFTIEAFVKDLYLSDPEHTEVRLRASEHDVFRKSNSWYVAIPGGNGNGADATVKAIYRDVDGTPTFWSDGVNGNIYPRTLRDGNWHHLALVVDGTDQSKVRVEVYVDYVKQYNASKTMEGPVYYDESDIWIGYSGTANSGWGGLIDEFRISDAALSPDEMLRFANPKADDDTLLYLSFDNWMGDLFKLNPVKNLSNNYLVNESGNVDSATPVIALRNVEVTIPEYLADAPGSLRRDIAVETAYADPCCLHPIMNSSHQTLGITYPLTGDRIVTENDFTIEMFVKCPELPTVDEYVMRNYSKFAGNGLSASWYITANASGKITFSSNWGKGATTAAAVLADGGWHHLAWVTEKATNTCRFYVDYAKIGEFSDAVYCPISPAGEADAGKLIFGSYAENGQNSQSYTGLLDDIRVTGRALEPQEFLTTRSPATAVLASASFENDLSEGPADIADLFAEGTLTGTGRYAPTRPFKSSENKKSIRLDGGTVNLGRNLLLERKGDFTLEFFLRPEALRGAANVVSLKKPAPSDEDVWSVSLSADKSTLSVGTAEFALPEVADWWHHYGLVFAEEEGLPVVTLYVDHVQVGEPTALAAAFDYSAQSRGLVVGSANLTGWIDEIRVTKGALATADMMACGPQLGFMLLLK